MEIRRFLAALQGRHRPILMMAVFTGMRASELRGLAWPDVDLQKNEINVRRRADKFGEIGAPKSEAAARTVPLVRDVANMLRELKVAAR
jgi:integrase